VGTEARKRKRKENEISGDEESRDSRAEGSGDLRPEQTVRKVPRLVLKNKKPPRLVLKYKRPPRLILRYNSNKIVG